MGIVFKQSFKNTLIIYLAFVFGGINTLFLYTNFLEPTYYGLVVFLLAYSNLIMPVIAFGVHHSIIKFFTSYFSKKEKDIFLSTMLFLPLFIALPIAFFINLFYEEVTTYLSKKNPVVKEYTFIIYLVAVACAYFEVFYAWAKVQFQSVFGNILKELWNRVVIMTLLFLVYFELISQSEFIYYLTAAYFLRVFIMMGYAFSIYFPNFLFKLPKNFTEILRYSGYIILAGSAGAIILDIDKAMIPGKVMIEKVAYYSVAVFLGSFIEAPGRAMMNILQPLTSKTLNENNTIEVASLYKKSSINLLTISGLFFILINTNIHQLYNLLPPKYAGGAFIVLMISLVKMYNMFLGNNGAIINNSKYYRITLPLAIGGAISVYFLNNIFFEFMGVNGFALATLTVIFIFNSIRILYVKNKFSVFPFTDKSWKMILIIASLYIAFNYWSFPIDNIYLWNFPIHPIFNIILKSILITSIYVFLILKLNISDELNKLFKRLYN